MFKRYRHGMAAAFTVIELLIALSIFSVIAITLYSTFFAGISTWKRSGDNTGIYQNIRVTFDDIARDLKNMIYFTKDDESAYIFSGTSEQVIFMTLEEGISEKTEPQRELVRIAYSFDNAKGDIVREIAGISLGFDTRKAEKEILLKNVEDFKVEYCYFSGDEDDPYLWQEEWSDEEVKTPRGVKITASLKGGKGSKETSKITRIVFISTGVLGEKEL